MCSVGRTARARFVPLGRSLTGLTSRNARNSPTVVLHLLPFPIPIKRYLHPSSPILDSMAVQLNFVSPSTATEDAGCTEELRAALVQPALEPDLDSLLFRGLTKLVRSLSTKYPQVFNSSWVEVHGLTLGSLSEPISFTADATQPTQQTLLLESSYLPSISKSVSRILQNSMPNHREAADHARKVRCGVAITTLQRSTNPPLRSFCSQLLAIRYNVSQTHDSAESQHTPDDLDDILENLRKSSSFRSQLFAQETSSLEQPLFDVILRRARRKQISEEDIRAPERTHWSLTVGQRDTSMGADTDQPGGEDNLHQLEDFSDPDWPNDELYVPQAGHRRESGHCPAYIPPPTVFGGQNELRMTHGPSLRGPGSEKVDDGTAHASLQHTLGWHFTPPLPVWRNHSSQQSDSVDEMQAAGRFESSVNKSSCQRYASSKSPSPPFIDTNVPSVNVCPEQSYMETDECSFEEIVDFEEGEEQLADHQEKENPFWETDISSDDRALVESMTRLEGCVESYRESMEAQAASIDWGFCQHDD